MMTKEERAKKRREALKAIAARTRKARRRAKEALELSRRRVKGASDG